jgi:hypothetical protein
VGASSVTDERMNSIDTVGAAIVRRPRDRRYSHHLHNNPCLSRDAASIDQFQREQCRFEKVSVTSFHSMAVTIP